MRRLNGIGELVKLFSSEHQEVQRFATGATRNLIYENMDNKVALIEEGGIPQLIEALKENDDELRKNITGRKMPDVETVSNIISRLYQRCPCDKPARIRRTTLQRNQSFFRDGTHPEASVAKPSIECVRPLL